MPWKRFVLATCLIINYAMSPSIFADDQNPGDYSRGGDVSHAGGAGTDTTTNTDRPTPADHKLDERYSDFIWKYFPFSKTEASKLYWKTLPDSLNAAIDHDREGPVADILCELIGTLDQAGRDKLLDEVDQRIDDERDKVVPDNKFIQFLRRAHSAVLIAEAKKGLSNQDLQNFNDEFHKKWVAYQKKQKNYLEEEDKALNSSGRTQTDAKKWLRDNTNRAAVGAYLDRNISSSDPKTHQQAVDLANALSWNNGGNHYLDFKGASDGQWQRLELGDDTEKALEAMHDGRKKVGGIGASVLVAKPNPKEDVTWFANDDGTLGKREDTATLAKSTGGKATGGSGQDAQGAASSGPKFDLTVAQNYLNGRCLGCHHTTMTVGADGKLSIDGEAPRSFTEILQAFPHIKNPKMAAVANDPEVLAKIQAWANAQ